MHAYTACGMPYVLRPSTATCRFPCVHFHTGSVKRTCSSITSRKRTAACLRQYHIHLSSPFPLWRTTCSLEEGLDKGQLLILGKITFISALLSSSERTILVSVVGYRYYGWWTDGWDTCESRKVQNYVAHRKQSRVSNGNVQNSTLEIRYCYERLD
jgi:hypothetical protein